MAHGYINLGKNTSFASKKELAWHGLGKVVDAMTSEEAIKLGGMDFEVSLAPLYAGLNIVSDYKTVKKLSYVIKDSGEKHLHYYKSKLVTNNFATYRKDTNYIFGIVGSRYEIIQNIEAFDFFDSIIGEGHAAYETVGALGNGEKIFITAKLPNSLIVNKENIDKYLLLTMAHDGSGAIQAMFTPVRVVCNNTLSVALSNNTNKISIRHTKNARNKLNIARKILGIIEVQTKTLGEVFNAFSKVKINEEDMTEIFRSSFGLVVGENGKLSTRASNILFDIQEFHETGIGQKGIEGTVWGAYNAITGYQQNIQTYKNKSVQFESINSKGASNVRQKAFNSLLQLI